MAILRRTIAAFGAFGWLSTAGAAPLDVFLTATPEPAAGLGTLELGVDRMNTQLDLLNLRSSTSNADTATNSYAAQHISGGLKLGDQGWLSGSLGQRAIADGAKVHGCSVHLVTPELDGGPVLLQAEVPVLPEDTADVLAARVLTEEHRIYPQALALLSHRIIAETP